MKEPETQSLEPAAGSSAGIEASVTRAFRKGNINFDFLQPDATSQERLEEEPSNRRSSARAGKRGLFNRGRPPQPVTRAQVYIWIFLCAASAFLLGALIAVGQSVILILAVPVLVSTLLWSLVMMTLFLARPH